jgi:hypothetical protein
MLFEICYFNETNKKIKRFIIHKESIQEACDYIIGDFLLLKDKFKIKVDSIPSGLEDPFCDKDDSCSFSIKKYEDNGINISIIRNKIIEHVDIDEAQITENEMKIEVLTAIIYSLDDLIKAYNVIKLD